MKHLAQLVSEDSRPPVQRLRRPQLRAFLDQRGIEYRADAPATDLVKVIEGLGVDVSKPIPGIEWQRFEQPTEAGGTRVEIYPGGGAPPASERLGVTDDRRFAVMEARQPSPEEQARALAESKRIAELTDALEAERRKSEELQAVIDARLAVLEQGRATVVDPELMDLSELTCLQLKKILGRQGKDPSAYPNRKDKLIAAIRGEPTDGEDAPQRDE